MGKYVSYTFTLYKYVTKEDKTAYAKRTAMRLHTSYLCIKHTKMNCRRIFKVYLLNMIVNTAHEVKINFYEPVHQIIEGMCH